jgi:ribosomal protein L37AE/L43A
VKLARQDELFCPSCKRRIVRPLGATTWCPCGAVLGDSFAGMIAWIDAAIAANKEALKDVRR